MSRHDTPPDHHVLKSIWIALAVSVCVGVLYLVLAPETSDEDKGASDYEELEACAFLTSLDSKKSLYLSSSHVARRSVTTGVGTQWDKGTWQLIDDEKRTFKISFVGKETVYTLVSAREGEGCMLVPGDTSKADLAKAWYSTLQDPK